MQSGRLKLGAYDQDLGAVVAKLQSLVYTSAGVSGHLATHRDFWLGHHRAGEWWRLKRWFGCRVD